MIIKDFWMIFCIILLFFLIFGVSLFYAGVSRSKNAQNSLLQVLFPVPIHFILWIIAGYSIVFGKDLFQFMIFSEQNFFSPHFLYARIESEQTSRMIHFLFNFLFATISCSIVVGAILERSRFLFSCIFSSCWLLFVYAPVARWVWNVHGFLFSIGAVDFAGGIVVHITSGFSAILLAWLLGRRKDFFNLRTRYNYILMIIGLLFIFMGWIGFNAGSLYLFTNQTLVIILNTILSAFAGSLSWMVIDLLHPPHKFSSLSLSSGIITGLVAITPCAPYVSTLSALLIGALTGFLANYSSRYIHKILKIDDVSDSFSTHGIGGLIGSILTGTLFQTGMLNSSQTHQSILKANFYSSFLVIAYSLAATGLLYYVIKNVFKISARSSESDEKTGLDLIYHGEKVINLTQES